MIDRPDNSGALAVADRRAFRSKVDSIRATYGFEDVSLAPGTDTVEPADVALEQVFYGIRLTLPILAAAMDAVVDVRLAGELARLGGLAKGRPALATVVIMLGMFTLAVPGSTNFAGEFAILSGVFQRGWGYAAIGAAAIVLAAMYALRLISAILHDRRASAADDGSSDLVGGELVLVLPLVAILAVLSAWPALVSERSFPLDQPSTFISSSQGVSG